MDGMCYVPHIDARSVAECVRAWRAAQPGISVLALVPEAEREAVGVIQTVCREEGVGLGGAVFPALIVNGAFSSGGAWLLRLAPGASLALYPDLPREAEALTQAVGRIAAALRPRLAPGSEDTLFLVFDALVPNIGSILDELYLALANRVHYMGANAGSERFEPMPCLFDGERIVGNGVLAVLLRAHRGAVLEHGYGVPQHMITATSTEGNRILQIDWRPAFEVYREMARAQYGIAIDRDNFYQYGVHFPFGIVRANGIILVRIPVALEEDGSLFCVGEVPPNAVLTLLRAPAVDSVHTLESVTDGLAAMNGPLAGRELLLFYCAGRRLHLGVEPAAAEIANLAGRTGARSIAGALSLGEIGSTTQWGYPLFHNATLVVSVWDGHGP